MKKFFSYLDTSLYLSILMGNKESEIYLKILDKSIILSSSLLLLEAERNIVRLTREKILTINEYKTALEKIKQDAELFHLRDFTPDLCLTGTFPPVSTPRSLDLVHLRTALWFRSENKVDYFFTLDQKLRQSAMEMDFMVHVDSKL